MPAAVAAATSTLVGSPRAEPTATSGRSRTGPATTSPSQIDDRGALGVDALGQCVGAVEAERSVVEPRVDDEVGHRGQPLDARPTERRGHEGGGAVRRHGRHARASYETPASRR